MRPLILLSNDDGYAADGLQALRRSLEPLAEVVVCAPEVNQSATSHSLSLHRVLRLRAVEPGVFAIDGTPADCVYVALHSGTRLLPRRPDLVVSGMNHGLNLGVDVFYSGTVAAAREGALSGVPAIAVSAEVGADVERAAALGARLSLALHAARSDVAGKPAPLLNVNVPKAGSWAVRQTRIGTRLYEQEVVYRQDPRGLEYLWIGGSRAHHGLSPGSDTEAFDEGCVGVTPLTLDLYAAHDADVARRVASSEPVTSASP